MSYRRRTAAAVVAAVPVAFLAVFFAWPLVVTAQRSLTDAGLAGTGSVIGWAHIADAALTTAILAAMGTALTLLIGIPAVWALHRRTWRGARVIEAVLTAPFVLPTIVVALAFLTLQRDLVPWLGHAHGVPAIVLALAFFNIAVVLRTVGPAIDAIDERLIAAARTLGASQGQATRRVIWPSVRRSVVAAGAITFLFCSTSFALVLVLGGTRVQTLEAAAYLELTTFLDLRGAATIAVVQAVLVGTLALTVARLTRSRGASIPASTVRAQATRREVGWAIATTAPALALVLAPLTTLLVRAFGGIDSPTLRHFTALWEGSSAQVPLGRSLAFSLGLAVVAAGVACLLGGLAVAAGALSPRWRWVRAATTGPLAVSSVVLGVGLLITLAVPMRAWASGPYILLIAAQSLVALPLVVHVLGPAADAIDRRQLAAAATLGAPPRFVILKVVTPLMRPAAASAAGLAFAVALGEFGASIFLVRPGTPTLPTTIARLLSRPGADAVDTAAAGAVLLAAIAGAVMMLVSTGRQGSR